MTNQEKISYIANNVNITESLIQLAEECNELSVMVMKYVRKLNGINPTPMSSEQIMNRIVEEYNDVRLCVDVLQTRATHDGIYNKKLNRWVKRLKIEEAKKYE